MGDVNAAVVAHEWMNDFVAHEWMNDCCCYRYGTVEAYEGGLAEDTNSTALLELYSQLLVHVQAFLNATATEPTE